MKHFHWQPLDAIHHLSTLSCSQAYLHDFASYGLTLADAQALQPASEYSVTKCDVILSIVQWGGDIRETLNKVTQLSDEQASALLQKTVASPRAATAKM